VEPLALDDKNKFDDHVQNFGIGSVRISEKYTVRNVVLVFPNKGMSSLRRDITILIRARGQQGMFVPR
jgi:hypothetical protein